MTFINLGLAIAGAAAVTIPIIIHLLFRRRRKPVMWGAMRFLMEAYRKQRRRLTLEQMLLLAARCLVILLLAMALGRPVLERAGVLGAGSARTLYFLVDNSLASTALAGESSALDAHKDAAAKILASLGPSDRAGFIALGAPAQPVVTPASSNLAAVSDLIRDLEPTDGPADFVGAADALRAVLGSDDAEAPEGDQIVVLLSDFRTGSADTAAPLPPSLATIEGIQLFALAPTEETLGNVQIVSVDPLRPVVLTGSSGAGLGDQVSVRLRRTGSAIGESGVSSVRVTAVTPGAGLNDRIASAQAEVRWSPGQSEATASVALNMIDGEASAARQGASAISLIAEIDRDALGADNVFRRPLDIKSKLGVAIIDRRRFGAAPTVDRLSPGDWIRLALAPTDEAPIDILEIEPTAIDAPSLAGVACALAPRPDLITSDGWRRLRLFVDAGGMLVIFPPATTELHLWSDGFAENFGSDWRIAREATEHEQLRTLAKEQPRTPILNLISDELADLVRPVTISRTVAIEEAPAGTQELLLLDDGSPWAVAGAPDLADGETGRGLVVYVTSAPALDWTDLPAKPLMVPLMQELVRQGVGQAQGAWASVAGGRIATPSRTAQLEPVSLDALLDDAPSLVVDASGRTIDAIRKSGLFTARDERGASRGLVAVNADAGAGRTDVQAPGVVQRWLAGLSGGAGEVAWIDRDEDALAGFAATADESRNSPVSLPLLLAALVIALLETVMARYFSHAFQSAPASIGGQPA